MAPSIDEILDQGRARHKRLELWLGVVILAGGLVWKLVVSSLTGGMNVMTFGAIGLGAVMIARGLFGSGRGAY